MRLTCKIYTFGMERFFYIVCMNMLITGGNGFLGQHLCGSFEKIHQVTATGQGERRIPFRGVAYAQADICAGEALRKLVLDVIPDVIIHAAALSKPDECERNREACYRVNVTGTEALIEAAKALRSPVHLVYISSDFVLGDGGPHNEETQPAPLNYYGTTKLLAEKEVEASGLLYTVVRPVFMYGAIWEGMKPTFLHWVRAQLVNGKPIKVVRDQQRTPTYVGDICSGIRSVIDKKAAGTYHLAGSDTLTPYDMAVALARLLQLDASLIEAVTADVFKEPVRRAKSGGLLIDKARRDLGYSPLPFAEGLKRAMEH